MVWGLFSMCCVCIEGTLRIQYINDIYIYMQNRIYCKIKDYNIIELLYKQNKT